MTAAPDTERPFVIHGPISSSARPGRVRSKARTVQALLPLLRPSARAVAYIGWVGHANLGDEAIFEACKRAFPAQRLISLPRDRTLSRIETVAPGGAIEGGLLGGGTLVGWDTYLDAVGRLQARCPAVPISAFGIGVLDPGFDYGRTAPNLGERLPRWVELLRSLNRVTLRGPRSQQILGELGLHAPVVGDPALLLADDPPAEPGAEGLLGLNIGISRSIWGSDPVGLLEEIVRFGRTLTSRGWRIRFLPMWPADLAYIREAAERIGSAAHVIDGYLDLDRTLDAMRECRVLVGLKLHAVVLASAVHVPSVMLEYQPKCADFQASLGRSEWSFRADRISAGTLVEHVEQLAQNYTSERATLTAAVLELRDRLRAEAAAIDLGVRAS